MIVTGDHVLGAQVQERPDVRAGDRFEEVGVAACDAMGQGELIHAE